MSSLNSVLATIFSLLWRPLGLIGPFGQLAVVSFVFGVIMVILFGKLSNQGAIKKVKNDIGAFLLESILFRYSLKLSLAAQIRLFWAGCRYFALAMWPVFVLLIPFAIILAHVNSRLGYRPLAIGEDRIVTVQLSEGEDVKSVRAEGSAGIEVTGPVRNRTDGTIYWRVKAIGEGDQVLTIRDASGGTLLEERVVVGAPNAAEPLGIFLSRSKWLSTLLYPNGGPNQRIGTPKIEMIEMSYPDRFYGVFGSEFSWITVFLVLSIVIGYGASKVLGIQV